MLAFELPLPWRLIIASWRYLAVLVADRSWASEQGSPRRRLWTGGSGARTLMCLWICDDKLDWRLCWDVPKRITHIHIHTNTNTNQTKKSTSPILSMGFWCHYGAASFSFSSAKLNMEHEIFSALFFFFANIRETRTSWDNHHWLSRVFNWKWVTAVTLPYYCKFSTYSPYEICHIQINRYTMWT